MPTLSTDQIAEMRAKALEWTGTEPAELLYDVSSQGVAGVGSREKAAGPPRGIFTLSDATARSLKR
ncbi:MAG: hypothetical protein AAGI54_04085 [Planctomycetota bacterium]